VGSGRKVRTQRDNDHVAGQPVAHIGGDDEYRAGYVRIRRLVEELDEPDLPAVIDV
jgi:hypothetical protein